MARNLRASQSKRIRANIQPDGSPMTPRKPLKKLAKKRGATRRKMFQHLVSPRWLKATSTEHQAVVEFVGSANRLATIHQYGLKDRIKGREIRYPARELLGVTTEEVEQVGNVTAAGPFDHVKSHWSLPVQTWDLYDTQIVRAMVEVKNGPK